MKPLTGVRILDLTQVWAGSKCTFLLAGLGAEVIKVESPRRSDIVRGAPGVLDPERVPNGDPGKRRYNRASTFNTLNRGKLGINLDLQTPDGMQLFKRLVALSDIVAENFSATVMSRLGLDYDVLRSIKPEIIMLSMPGFGSYGPERDNISWADTIEAMAGFCQRTGYDDGRPMYSVQAYPDPFSGIYGAAAVLTALRHRRRTGRGQRIEISQHEALLTMNADALLEYQMNGRIMGPVGNTHPFMAPHGVYPCAAEEEWIAIAVRDDTEWASLCGVMGGPPWTRDPRFETVVGRLSVRAELDAHVAAWTRGYAAEALQRQLQRGGVAAGRVASTRDLASDSQLQARGTFEMVTHPDAGTHPYAAAVPFHFTHEPMPPASPAPLFGQHNAQVLRELLGLSDEEIERLAEQGVISDEPEWARSEAEARLLASAAATAHAGTN
jgi:crotonobetainyl-CoA:carnitine CoA-transferase CaiB-like acyl-CoA transferase